MPEIQSTPGSWSSDASHARRWLYASSVMIALKRVQLGQGRPLREREKRIVQLLDEIERVATE